MALTPDEVVKYPLKQVVRGYSVKEVDELLDRVADELERLRAETEELRGRLQAAEARLADSSETEQTLTRTLVTAQRAAEGALEEARQRADEMLEEARAEAAETTATARREAEAFRREVVDAARDEEAALQGRRDALEAHLEALRRFDEAVVAELTGVLDEQRRRLDALAERPREQPPPTPAELDEPAPAGPAVRDDVATPDVLPAADPAAAGADAIADATPPEDDTEEEPLAWLEELTGPRPEEPTTTELPAAADAPPEAAADEEPDGAPEPLFGDQRRLRVREHDEAAPPHDADAPDRDDA